MANASFRASWTVVAVASVSACSVAEVPIAPISQIEPAAQAPIGSDRHVSSQKWPENENCVRLLEVAREEHRAGRLFEMSETSPIAILVDDSELSIIGDMPLPVTSQAQASVFDCLIVVGEADRTPNRPRQLISERKLRSTYPAGFKSARKRADAPDESTRRAPERLPIEMTGDPTVDLVGILAEGILTGIDAVFTDDEMDVDSDPIGYAETPEQKLEPYSYKLSELTATRSAKIPVALVDQRSFERIESVLDLQESQLFALSDDRHPQDPVRQHDNSARLVSTLQLQRWEASPPSVAISTLVDHLQAPIRPVAKDEIDRERLFGAGEISAISPHEEIEPALGASHAAPEKPWLASTAELIRIKEGNGEAYAFYVGPEHLIAPEHALPITALVPLEFADGAKVYGLVEERDSKSGLALLFTPRPGSAWPLANNTDPVLSVPESAVAGQPLLQENRVLGFWLADPLKGDRFVSADEIDAFTARNGLAGTKR